MTGHASKVNLFGYLNYRQFLQDWYQAAKIGRGSFSFRTFSQRAGFKSPNFFKLVMDGDRNLTEESLTKFMVGLKLNKQEQDFFRNLVFFNQADEHGKRAYYYERLLQSRKFSELKPIAKDQYDFYGAWHHPVVRELIGSSQSDGSAEWIASRLLPPISVAQVQKSVELLEKLGFIEKRGHRFKQSTPLVSTGAECDHLALLNYHQHILSLAKDMLPRVPPASRDVSVLTLGISRTRLSEIKRRIQLFRKELMELVSTDTEPEEVVLLAIQLLPLTKPDCSLETPDAHA